MSRKRAGLCDIVAGSDSTDRYDTRGGGEGSFFPGRMNLHEGAVNSSARSGIIVHIGGGLSFADEKAERVTRSVTNYLLQECCTRSDHIWTNGDGVKVIVQAGIMSAVALAVINNNGPTESVTLGGMIMVHRQRRISF